MNFIRKISKESTDYGFPGEPVEKAHAAAVRIGNGGYSLQRRGKSSSEREDDQSFLDETRNVFLVDDSGVTSVP